MPASVNFLCSAARSWPGLVKGNDAARVFSFRLRVQHCKTFGLQRGHEPRAFAQQFGGDVFDADFQHQFHGGDQADQAQQIVRAGFVFRRAVAENNLFLRDKIRAAHVVPAVNRRVHPVLQFRAGRKAGPRRTVRAAICARRRRACPRARPLWETRRASGWHRDKIKSRVRARICRWPEHQCDSR